MLPYLLRAAVLATALASLAVMFLPVVDLYTVEGDWFATTSLFAEYPGMALQAGLPPMVAVVLAWIVRARPARFLAAAVLCVWAVMGWVWAVLGPGSTPTALLFLVPSVFLTIAAFAANDA